MSWVIGIVVVYVLLSLLARLWFWVEDRFGVGEVRNDELSGRKGPLP